MHKAVVKTELTAAKVVDLKAVKMVNLKAVKMVDMMVSLGCNEG